MSINHKKLEEHQQFPLIIFQIYLFSWIYNVLKISILYFEMFMLH